MSNPPASDASGSGMSRANPPLTMERTDTKKWSTISGNGTTNGVLTT